MGYIVARLTGMNAAYRFGTLLAEPRFRSYLGPDMTGVAEDICRKGSIKTLDA